MRVWHSYCRLVLRASHLRLIFGVFSGAGGPDQAHRCRRRLEAGAGSMAAEPAGRPLPPAQARRRLHVKLGSLREKKSPVHAAARFCMLMEHWASAPHASAARGPHCCDGMLNLATAVLAQPLAAQLRWAAAGPRQQ